MLVKLKNRLKDQRGLTLVELLAVIVILGIIAAIAVPAIGGIIDKTEKDAQVSEGIQIINSAKLYMSAHQFKADESHDTQNTEADIEGTMVLNYTEHLEPYLENVTDPEFYVEITKNSTTGKYKYYLTNHESVELIHGDDEAATIVSEEELLNY